MTESDLLDLLKKHEADRVEFTIATKDTDKFSEAICAFANDLPQYNLPGYLIIGVDNQGHFSGLAVSDELLRNLGAIRAQGNIQPLPTMTVEKLTTAQGEAAVVTVHPALQPPVRYRGRVCIRVGPRRGYATEHEERILIERRVSRAKTFDAEPCPQSTIDDLAVRLFKIDYLNQAIAEEVVAENKRSIEHQLASLRFYDVSQNCPTNAGVILFGLDVRRWLPGAYVQFLRIDGDSLAGDVVNDRELSGDLLTVLRDLDAIIDAHLSQFPVPESVLRERSVESFPRVAVREIVMNAIMHRDYSSTAPLRITWFNDRIEIQSPGGLYGEVSSVNFPQQTSYRNPVIAEAMKNLGYVNRFGRGVLRAQHALESNGSDPAEFVFDSGFVLAILRKRP